MIDRSEMEKRFYVSSFDDLRAGQEFLVLLFITLLLFLSPASQIS